MGERRGLRPDDALVDELAGRVRAGALDRAGIEHLVAGTEQRHVLAYGDDGARGVPAEDTVLIAAVPGGADFHVDRVDRHGLHLDQKVVARRRAGGGDPRVNQAVGVVQ